MPPIKNEDPTSIPRTCRAEKLGDVVHPDNPGSEEAETGGSLEASPPAS